jgi:DNA polymerase-3 subunit delta
MTCAEFRAAVKRRDVSGGYLFYGDEEYMKQHTLEETRKSVLGESGADMNRIKITDENYTAGILADIISTYPSIGSDNKKFIEIHSLNLDDMNDSDFAELSETLSDLGRYAFNVLVLYTVPDEFNAGYDKRPSKLFTQLTKYLTPVTFNYEQLSSLIKWCVRGFAANKINADPETCEKLINTAGRDMYNLKNEIEKLSSYLLYNERDTLTPDDIAKITIQTVTIDAFDFANAILEGNIDKAFYILTDKKVKREKPEFILSLISRVYNDLYLISQLSSCGMTQKTMAEKLNMHEYKIGIYLKSIGKKSKHGLNRALDICMEADRKIKSTTLDSYMVLDKLIVELANA